MPELRVVVFLYLFTTAGWILIINTRRTITFASIFLLMCVSASSAVLYERSRPLSFIAHTRETEAHVHGAPRDELRYPTEYWWKDLLSLATDEVSEHTSSEEKKSCSDDEPEKYCSLGYDSESEVATDRKQFEGLGVWSFWN